MASQNWTFASSTKSVSPRSNESQVTCSFLAPFSTSHITSSANNLVTDWHLICSLHRKAILTTAETPNMPTQVQKDWERSLILFFSQPNAGQAQVQATNRINRFLKKKEKINRFWAGQVSNRINRFKKEKINRFWAGPRELLQNKPSLWGLMIRQHFAHMAFFNVLRRHASFEKDCWAHFFSSSCYCCARARSATLIKTNQ